MITETVGIREFRMKLADYITQSDRPVAITRHGATIGYFIPARVDRQKAHHASLLSAAETLDAMLSAAGLTDREIGGVQKPLRKARKNNNGRKPGRGH